MNDAVRTSPAAARVHWFAVALVTVVFGYAFLSKLADPGALIAALSRSIEVGSPLWILSAVVVAPMELLVAIMVAIPSTRRSGLTLAGVMLVAFTVFLIINQVRGIHVDCACFGSLWTAGSFWRSNLGGVVRNSILLVIVSLAINWLPFQVAKSREPSLPSRALPDAPHVRAFTLVELLVVVGIIGILLTLVSGLAARSRQSTQALICANNLRGVMVDAFNMASSNGGYLPLSGRIVLSTTGPHSAIKRDGLPALLGDPGRQRYRYYRTDDPIDRAYLPVDDGLIPFVLAVSGVVLDTNNYFEAFPHLTKSLDDYLSAVPSAKRLVCPSGKPGEDSFHDFPVHFPISYQAGDFITPDHINVPRSYAVNAILLGFDATQPAAKWALRGKLGAIGGPAESYVVIADGDGRGVNWSVRQGYDGPSVSLLDVSRRTESAFDPIHTSLAGLPRKRHRAGFNAAFADGSVRSLSSDDDLSRSFLLYGR